MPTYVGYLQHDRRVIDRYTHPIVAFVGDPFSLSHMSQSKLCSIWGKAMVSNDTSGTRGDRASNGLIFYRLWERANCTYKYVRQCT